MRIVNVAIAGLGGVGRTTAELLLGRRERYRAVYGADVRLVAVCGSRAGLLDAAGLSVGRLGSLEEGSTGPALVEASGANILIEAGPTDYRTGEPGLTSLRAALRDGRHAIVVSKGALVLNGRALRDLAAGSGAMLKVSGAAGAALPALDLLDGSLLGCAVLRIDGILNATTNAILDAMMTRASTFEEALREAQAAGHAEADPRNDVEGWDTAVKLLLLANFGLGLDLTMNDVAVSGIQDVTRENIADWQRERLVPKLVGSLTLRGSVPHARVGIQAYAETDPFAQVGGKNKAVRIVTDAAGETLAISAGSEPLATAAAALKDLEHILRALRPAG